MNPTFIKSLIGVGVAGASVAGGYGIYSVAFKTPTKTIEQALEEDSNIVLLSMEENKDKEKWDEKVNTLETGSETLTGYQKSGNDDETKKTSNRSKLKDICKELFKLDSATKDKLATAKKWCTKPKSE